MKRKSYGNVHFVKDGDSKGKELEFRVQSADFFGTSSVLGEFVAPERIVVIWTIVIVPIK